MDFDRLKSRQAGRAPKSVIRQIMAASSGNAQIR